MKGSESLPERSPGGPRRSRALGPKQPLIAALRRTVGALYDCQHGILLLVLALDLLIAAERRLHHVAGSEPNVEW